MPSIIPRVLHYFYSFFFFAYSSLYSFLFTRSNFTHSSFESFFFLLIFLFTHFPFYSLFFLLILLLSHSSFYSLFFLLILLLTHFSFYSFFFLVIPFVLYFPQSLCLFSSLPFNLYSLNLSAYSSPSVSHPFSQPLYFFLSIHYNPFPKSYLFSIHIISRFLELPFSLPSRFKY